jgi:DNA-binding response OmpR family regulator
MSFCILISDAQTASRRMLRFAMDLKGGKILECAGGDGTMALLEEHRVDLLLLSLYPRPAEGDGVLEKLREHCCRTSLPVILIGDTVLRGGFDSSRWCATAWLDRPFRVSELLTLVDSILFHSPSDRISPRR